VFRSGKGHLPLALPHRTNPTPTQLNPVPCACSAPEVEQLASTSPPPSPSRARHATAATRSGLGRRARGTAPPSEICPPAAAMASAHEEAAAWSEEAARLVWGGAVQLQVHLHDADVTALPPPPPFLVCHTPLPRSPPSEGTGCCCCCPLVASVSGVGPKNFNRTGAVVQVEALCF
jgi:autophagy-related protein 5